MPSFSTIASCSRTFSPRLSLQVQGHVSRRPVVARQSARPHGDLHAVFSVLFPVSKIDHYPLYLLSGLAIWVFLSATLPTSARSLLDNANLIKKVRFPRQLTALSTVAAQLVALGAILVVLIPVNMIVIPDTRETIWLDDPADRAGDRASSPVFARRCGRERHLPRHRAHRRGAAAPVVLPHTRSCTRSRRRASARPDRRPPTLVSFLHWGNPITPPIEAVRDVLFWGRLPHVDVVYLLVAAVLALALGAWASARGRPDRRRALVQGAARASVPCGTSPCPARAIHLRRPRLPRTRAPFPPSRRHLPEARPRPSCAAWP